MRKSLGLLVPFFLAACGQSMTPFMNIDSGAPGDDLSTGGGGSGGRDMAGAKGDMTGVGDGGEFDTTRWVRSTSATRLVLEEAFELLA